eukprot:snap_masked-scaffold_51-processed-gene-1.14-mRNA-1 protein AED:1.00 eAED:1.00 QI:0/-1/0/0/-1/1/1/0/63
MAEKYMLQKMLSIIRLCLRPRVLAVKRYVICLPAGIDTFLKYIHTYWKTPPTSTQVYVLNQNW